MSFSVLFNLFISYSNSECSPIGTNTRYCVVKNVC